MIRTVGVSVMALLPLLALVYWSYRSSRYGDARAGRAPLAILILIISALIVLLLPLLLVWLADAEGRRQVAIGVTTGLVGGLILLSTMQSAGVLGLSARKPAEHGQEAAEGGDGGRPRWPLSLPANLNRLAHMLLALLIGTFFASGVWATISGRGVAEIADGVFPMAVFVAVAYGVGVGRFLARHGTAADWIGRR